MKVGHQSLANQALIPSLWTTSSLKVYAPDLGLRTILMTFVCCFPPPVCSDAITFFAMTQIILSLCGGCTCAAPGWISWFRCDREYSSDFLSWCNETFRACQNSYVLCIREWLVRGCLSWPSFENWGANIANPHEVTRDEDKSNKQPWKSLRKDTFSALHTGLVLTIANGEEIPSPCSSST